MSKLPYIPLYIGDWLKDPKLSLCEPATRGIWMDMICAMHEMNRSGELRGTHEQLARITRSSTEQLIQAINELQITGAAEVTDRNKIVTVTNRRMKREATDRILIKKRVEKHRLRKAESDVKPNCNAGVTPIEDESEIENSGNSGIGGRATPSIEECKDMSGKIGLPESEGELFFHHYNGQGWVSGSGLPVIDWVSFLHKWKAKWETGLRAKCGANENSSSEIPINSVHQAKQVIEELERNIRVIRNDSKSWEWDGGIKQGLKPHALETIKTFKTKIEEIKKRMGGTAL